MANDTSNTVSNQANAAGKYQDQAPIQVQVDPNAYLTARAKLAAYLMPGSESLVNMQKDVAAEDRKLAQINAAIEKSRNAVLGGNTLSQEDVALTAPTVQAADLKANDKAEATGCCAVADALDIKIKSPTPQMREARAEITKHEAKKAKLARLHTKHPERLARHENLVKSTAHVRAEPESEAVRLARVTISRERQAEARGVTISGQYIAWANPNSAGDMVVAAADAARMNNPNIG